jgi:hypothetical protein
MQTKINNLFSLPCVKKKKKKKALPIAQQKIKTFLKKDILFVINVKYQAVPFSTKKTYKWYNECYKMKDYVSRYSFSTDKIVVWYMSIVLFLRNFVCTT